jgi:CubicO group peptidase (beta-lactamase class C family)
MRCLRLLVLLAGSVAAQQTDTAARLDRAFTAIDRALAASTNPGMVIGITDRDRTLKIGAYGYADIQARKPVTADTLFEIGSVTKSFTAISLMQLFDEGRFDPQAPLSKYLPWFQVKSKFRAITGHDILTHTAGLQSYRPDLASMPFAAWSLRDFEPSYAPGEHYWYSNLGSRLWVTCWSGSTARPMTRSCTAGCWIGWACGRHTAPSTTRCGSSCR